MEKESVKVSIVVPVYNHERYLVKCIESILMQKCDFNYDVWIGDDCSTDNSKNVLLQLEKQCPPNFHFIYREKNIFPNNIHDLISRSNSEYIAHLEGDDYWTCKTKLQSQIDYMDEHPECVASFHDCIVVDQNSDTIDETYPTCPNEFYTFKDFEKRYLPGQTSSSVTRRIYYRVLDDFIENYKLYYRFPGDRRKAFLALFIGRVKIFHSKWSAYRHVTLPNSTSYSATYTHSEQVRRDEVLFYKSLKNYAASKENSEAYDVSSRLYYSSFIRKCFGKNKLYSFSDFLSELCNEKKKLNYLFFSLRDTFLIIIKDVIRGRSARQKQ